MDWDQVKIFHQNPPLTPNMFPRSITVTEKYQKYKEYLDSIGISMSQDILNRYFTSLDIIERGYVLTPNDFPYDLKSNIDHLLLWIHPSILPSGQDISICIDQSMKELGYKDFIWFENRVGVRSILDIRHFHIFGLSD